MCKPFSCVVDAAGQVYVGADPSEHSHEVILIQHRLHEPAFSGRFARVELSPADGDYTSDPDSWKLVLDEDRTPQWWTEDVAAMADRVQLAAKK